MPEALARADHDFVYAEPRPKARKPPRRAPQGAEKAARIAHRTAKYTSLLAGAVVAALITGILVNALALQKARHPAPLFAKSISLPAVEPPPAEPAPMPAPRPAALTALVETVTEKANAPAPRQRPAPAEAETPPQRDQIAQLLKSGQAPRAATPAAIPAEPSKSVLGAQRALLKLGFVIKPDGHFGATTRQALEQFERDRSLPIKGELTPKILRELSSQSGVAIE